MGELNGSDPAPATFLGNHDMGRAALMISQQAGGGLTGGALLRRVLLGYDLLYLLRGAPVVYYGDEVGMIGTGGDQQARQDMFPTQVAEWQTQPRVGSPPIGTGSSFDVTGNPIEARLRELARLREENPALATGATIVRVAKGGLIGDGLEPLLARLLGIVIEGHCRVGQVVEEDLQAGRGEGKPVLQAAVAPPLAEWLVARALAGAGTEQPEHSGTAPHGEAGIETQLEHRVRPGDWFRAGARRTA